MQPPTVRPGSAGFRLVQPYARPQAGRLAASADASVAQVACSLLRRWPLALAVDSALGGRPPVGVLAGAGPVVLLAVAGLATVVLSVCEGLLDLAAEVTAEGAAERIGAPSARRSLARP